MYKRTAGDRTRAEVVVVGGGIIGLTTACELARLGVADVIVLEAGEPGRQSTGRSSGGIRRQFGNRLEIEMSLAGLRFYESVFADQTFEGRFADVGYAFLAGPQRITELGAAWQLQREMGLAVEWLDRTRIVERFPYIDGGDLVGGTFCQQDGIVDPWAIVRWLLRACHRLGVVVCNDSPVDDIELADGRANAVRSGARRIEAAPVVNAAGAWAGRIGVLAGVPIPVSPSPRFQMVTEPQSGLPATTPFLVDLETGAHMRTEQGRAIAGVRPTSIPVGFDLKTDYDPIAWLAERASIRFPTLRNARVSGFIMGLYEITPDGLPVAGAVEEVPGLYVVAGFNGHGIMHGPPVAQAVAELIVKGRAKTFDIAPLAPQRFSGEHPHAAERVSSLL